MERVAINAVFYGRLNKSMNKATCAKPKFAAVRLTLRVKGQNPIDSEKTGYDIDGQPFLQKKYVFDKKMIGKTENDRQISL